MKLFPTARGPKELDLETRNAGGLTLDEILRMTQGGEGDLSRVFAGPASRLPIIYSCVSLAAERLQELPMMIADPGGQPRKTQPAWMKRPTPGQTWEDFVSMAVWSLIGPGPGSGNWYLLPLRDGRGAVQMVATLDPCEVSILEHVGDEPIYTWRGREIPGEIVHTRWMTRAGTVRGIGPLEAAMTTSRVADASQDRILRHFTQGAQLQYIVTSSRPLGSEAVKEAAAQMAAQITGPSNAYRPHIFDGFDIKPIGQKATEAQYLELARWTDAKIAAQIYHQDPTLHGVMPEGSSLTYSNAMDRDRNLWNDALKPMANRIEQACRAMLGTGWTAEVDPRPLLSGGPSEMIATAKQMAEVNTTAGREIFSPEEIRKAGGHPPAEHDMGTMETPAPTTMEPANA